MANGLLPLGLVLLATAVALVAGAAWATAGMILRPPRMTDGKAAYVLKRLSPGDLGLRYEDVAFTVRDERTGRPLRIAGWWVPHPAAAGRCAVLIHGYADAKVGAIAWAPTFHSLGFNILAIDLRAHGASEGAHSTAGYFERHDVNQVIDQLRARRPHETRTLVLFGVSLGAAVAAAAAASRDDLAAVILDCPFAVYRDAATVYVRSLGVPRVIARLAIRLAEAISSADFDQVRPIDMIRKISFPLMMIHSTDDPLVGPLDARAFSEAAHARLAEQRATIVHHIDATHLSALAQDPRQYQLWLVEFLGRALVFCGGGS